MHQSQLNLNLQIILKNSTFGYGRNSICIRNFLCVLQINVRQAIDVYCG